MPSIPISISGSGMVEGSKKRLFVPRLNNKYEQRLYEEIAKSSGIHYWRVNQFDPATQGGHLDAVSQAFEQAMKSAGLYRKVNRKMSSRIGIIYFNMHGPTSFMNKEFQVKEMFQSDVFPAFLLNNHNITGYSVRLRDERNGLFQALELARTLIQAQELDIVLVGGVFQSYSYLYLTEMLAASAWQSDCQLESDKTASTYTLCESAGFLVVEASATTEKRQEKRQLDIHELGSYRPSKSNHSIKSLDLSFPSLNGKTIQQCYLGLSGLDGITELERSSLNTQFPDASLINTNQQWGDLVNLNGVKVLHEHRQQNSRHSSLLHSIDRTGNAWNLIFTNHHKNRM